MGGLSVILALDSFKGSVSALQACHAVKQGLEAAGKALGITVQASYVPISDGGEGLLQCLSPMLLKQGYQLQAYPVFAPYGTINEANVLVSGSAAVIESAEAIGLELTAANLRDCVSASTYGLGQLLSKLLDQGVNQIDLGLGGSATNDCGIGMAQALGVKFYDQQGQDLGMNTDGSLHRLCGLDLLKVDSLDDSQLQQRLIKLNLELRGSCDVDNPLCGDEGATAVFGPQKGLSPEVQPELERGMLHVAQVLERHYGKDREGRSLSDLPGSGAAGGVGAALRYFFKGHSQLLPGLEMVANAYKIDDLLQKADLVIVGEGCMDSQSAHGKAPVGIARKALKHHVPCIALCGALKADATALYAQGISAMFAIANGPLTLEQSKQQASALLSAAAENIMRCFVAGRSCD